MEHTARYTARAAALLVALYGCSDDAASAAPALRSTLAEPASAPASAATAPASAPATQEAEFLQEGSASYYADKFHGKKTASGERYDKRAFTCAHRRLPFGTLVKVEHVKTGKSVVVRVNDRGPFGKGVIDLSRAAAEQIGMIAEGRAKVRVSVLPPVE